MSSKTYNFNGESWTHEEVEEALRLFNVMSIYFEEHHTQ